jgi:hypothetical protein
LWDAAVETGEIATAILLPTTQTKDLSHAAKKLPALDGFKPKVLYSDTWPAKSDYWALLFGD